MCVSIVIRPCYLLWMFQSCCSSVKPESWPTFPLYLTGHRVTRDNLWFLPPEQPPPCCSVGFWRQKDAWVPDLEPPRSRAGEQRAWRSERLLCRDRNAERLDTRSTTAPATFGSPAGTSSLHDRVGRTFIYFEILTHSLPADWQLILSQPGLLVVFRCFWSQ